MGNKIRFARKCNKHILRYYDSTIGHATNDPFRGKQEEDKREESKNEEVKDSAREAVRGTNAKYFLKDTLDLSESTFNFKHVVELQRKIRKEKLMSEIEQRIQSF